MQIGNFHIGRAQTAELPVLTAGEAYMLWDHLVSRYDTIMQTKIYQNYAHDPEFKTLLTEGLAMILEKQVKRLEKEMEIYKMPLPQPTPKSVSIKTNAHSFTDQFIFKRIFSAIQKFIDNHVRAIRIIVVNDPLRRLFIKLTGEEIKAFDRMCKYGKIKGWIDIQPLTDNNGDPKKISTGEAYLLWDNLNSRYDYMEFINLYQNFIHNPDFKNMMVESVDGIMTNQINHLEQVMSSFELEMPPRPAERPYFTGYSAVITDNYIFRRFFTSVQDFLDLCSRSIQVAVTNDELREMYIDFFFKKLDIFDEMCMYGKLKGWFEVAPFMNPQ